MNIYLVLFFSIVLSTIVVNVDALRTERPAEVVWKESKSIFVGTIIDVEELPYNENNSNTTIYQDRYMVTVEEFVKNPMDTKIVFVRQPLISIPGPDAPTKGFEEGDRVLFYLDEKYGEGTYAPESTLLPSKNMNEQTEISYQPKIINFVLFTVGLVCVGLVSLVILIIRKSSDSLSSTEN